MPISIDDQAMILLIVVGVIFAGFIVWTMLKATVSLEKTTIVVGFFYISLVAMTFEAYVKVKFEILALLLVGLTVICLYVSYRQWRFNNTLNRMVKVERKRIKTQKKRGVPR